MNKTIASTIISIVIFLIVASVYEHFAKDYYGIGLLIYGTGYLVIQTIVGIVLFAITKNKQTEQIAKGLMLGAGIVLLIGFSICSVGALRN